MSRQIFVNLPIKNMEKSQAFFRALGFEFNPQFTNDSGACMVVSDEAFVMLLGTEFFKGFTKREICDTRTHTECLIAISCESRAQVDEMVRTAVANGGSHAVDPNDMGFMYNWSFYDLDGHHWEVRWMDPAAMP